MAAIPSATPSSITASFVRSVSVKSSSSHAASVYFPPRRRSKKRQFAISYRLYSSKASSNGFRVETSSASCFSCGEGCGGELQYSLPPPPHPAALGVPVFVTLPENAVNREGYMTRRKPTAAAFMAMVAAGVVGVTVELWWGVVERKSPGVYDWSGYLDLVSMAREHGLKVRAVMAFHQCGAGPSDPLWIPLPRWVLEQMEAQPDLLYTDMHGRKSPDYLSLGCDTLAVLKGRTPIQAYTDFMRSFRDTFRDFLGVTVIEIVVGMGPEGELKYPSSSLFDELMSPERAPEIGDFHCYDKHMLASLRACAQHIGMVRWGEGPRSDAINVLRDPELTNFFRRSGTWNSAYGRFFLEWYSGMLLLHGERLCTVANSVFSGTSLNISAKVAGMYGHYYTCSHPSELTAGYYNTIARDGYVPIARLLARFGMTLCCPCFDVRDQDMLGRPGSGPEGLLHRLVATSQALNLPLSGENSLSMLDDASLDQVVASSRLYYEGARTPPCPSLSFNYLRMNRAMFDHRNWARFTRLVKQLSDVRIDNARLERGRAKSCLFTTTAADDLSRVCSCR